MGSCVKQGSERLAGSCECSNKYLHCKTRAAMKELKVFDLFVYLHVYVYVFVYLQGILSTKGNK